VFSQSKTNSYGVRAVRAGHYLPDPPQLSDSGSSAGIPPDRSCADVNESDSVTASDSLAVLKKAVGQQIDLVCAPLRPTLRTGQNACYSSLGAEIPCAGTGQDADIQFGTPRSFTNNQDGTITDNRTGLQWEILTLDGSIHDASIEYSWTNAIGSKIASLNSNDFAGHDDWRLPNQFELMTIVDFGEANPPTYVVFDTNCMVGCTNAQCSCNPVSGRTWSSTTYHVVKTSAWQTRFSDGEGPSSSKQGVATVRAVRGGW